MSDETESISESIEKIKGGLLSVEEKLHMVIELLRLEEEPCNSHLSGEGCHGLAYFLRDIKLSLQCLHFPILNLCDHARPMKKQGDH